MFILEIPLVISLHFERSQVKPDSELDFDWVLNSWYILYCTSVFIEQLIIAIIYQASCLVSVLSWLQMKHQSTGAQTRPT